MVEKTREEEILLELDQAQAPDQADRVAFSTFAKQALRKGETWRGRLIRWIEQQKES